VWVWSEVQKVLRSELKSATRQSFTIEDEGKKHHVQIADVLLFDFPDF
jgi:hypothetical protein